MFLYKNTIQDLQHCHFSLLPTASSYTPPSYPLLLKIGKNLFEFNFRKVFYFLVSLPDLIHRAILISGSALSPWAIQRDPLSVKKKVATDTGCYGDLLDDDIAPCLRKKSISELLAIKLDTPR